MSTETLRNSANGTTIPYTYMTSGNKDRLLTYNGSGALTYDGFGNPKQWFKHGTEGSELKYALNWSHVNRLTKITDRDTGEKYEYTYNHNGIRTSKKVGSTEHKYYLDGSNIIAETRTTGDRVDKLEYYYDTTGIVGFRYNGNDYYYTKNIQGDIERIYNSTGSTYAVYEYDAWGNRKITYDPNGIAGINPFGYRGYYLDNETKLWYLNSRYYDSAVGRFLSPDRLDYLDPESLGGLNLYTYCNNNPVMYYDPSGTFAISSFLIGLGIAAAISALVGGVSYAASVLITGIFTGDFSWSWGMFLGSIIGSAIGGALIYAFQLPIGIGAFITGGLSTAIGMALSNAFGESHYSVLEILVCTAISSVTSGVFASIMSYIKIPKLTGRGSYGAITKQIFTKFYNGLIRSMTAKTFGKMFAYTLTYNTLNIVSDGIIGIVKDYIQKKKKKKNQEVFIGGQ